MTSRTGVTGLVAAALAGIAALLWNGDLPGSKTGFSSSAEARVGRPATPLSYAGVARRTTRRTVAAGAAVGAGAYYAAPGYYPAPTCVQIVNAYGQVAYRCP